jgi:uncharacterized membrane protein YphA (DoxX/SURF4 family)
MALMASRKLLWPGWIVTALVGALFLFSATMKFVNPPEMQKNWSEQFGYPDNTRLPIAIVEIVCVVLFLVPRTAVLGAVLLTGYLGGAIATHVRVNDNFIPGVVFGVLVWLALFLRDARIRALLPFRTATRGH